MLTVYALGALALVAFALVARTFKVVKEYERGVKFTLGQFEAVMEPGLRSVIPRRSGSDAPSRFRRRGSWRRRRTCPDGCRESILNDEEGALHLRTLQTLNSLSSDDSNTVIFAVPAEALRALEGIGVDRSGK